MELVAVRCTGRFRFARLVYRRADGGEHVAVRKHGDDLFDLPAEHRKKIEAEWTAEVRQALRDEQDAINADAKAQEAQALEGIQEAEDRETILEAVADSFAKENTDTTLPADQKAAIARRAAKMARTVKPAVTR